MNVEFKEFSAFNLSDKPKYGDVVTFGTHTPESVGVNAFGLRGAFMGGPWLPFTWKDVLERMNDKYQNHYSYSVPTMTVWRPGRRYKPSIFAEQVPLP
jgi:hypothetical protein